MADFISSLTPAVLFALLTLAGVLVFLFVYWYTAVRRRNDLSWISREAAAPERRMRLTRRGRMTGKDVLPLLLLTAVYAFTAFFRLGSFNAPTSSYDFIDGDRVEIVLEEPVVLSSLRTYSGLGTGSYNVEVSADEEKWSTLWAHKDDEGKITGYYWADAEGYSPSYALSQKYSDLFKWQTITPENPLKIRYLRITGKADRSQTLLELAELVLYDEDGKMIDASRIYACDPLFDEQSIVPEDPTWYDSSYFDEIYHPRTAWEHIRNIPPYEVSHPPLGKLTQGLGIRLFGMDPFGWRCVGTLFGVLMLPILYIFLKNLFGRTAVAFCGTAVFAFDFMHLTQTRIGTIDTYGVFYILLMYFFLYRWMTLPDEKSFLRQMIPLFLSGLFWGIGAASKWTVIYGGVGLAVLYVIGLVWKVRDRPAGKGRFGYVVGTLLFSVVFFVAIPAVIYTASYIPYARARDVEITLSSCLTGAKESFPILVKDLVGFFREGKAFQTIPIPQDTLPGIMAQNQWYMLTYHSGVHSYHPYASRWYQWIVNARPILYYRSYPADGWKMLFAAFHNPVLCWGGGLALLSCIVEIFRRRSAAALFIVIGYFSQLAPWLAIGRVTFAYHYFPSALFLAFALAFLMDGLAENSRRWKLHVFGLTGGAAALYAAFYPVLIGLPIPNWYAQNFLRWFPSWPL